MKTREQRAEVGSFFVLVTLWYAMEYLRPQDYVHAFGLIRPALLLFIVTFMVWLARGDKGVVKDGLIVGMLIFLVLGALSIPFANNYYWAAQSNFYLISFLFAGILPFVSFMDRPEAMRRFFNWWVFFNVLVAIASIIRGGRGSGSFMQDENDLALTLAMALPFAYFLGTHGTRSALTKTAFIIAGLILIAGIVVTRSRGGFLGLMMAGLAVIWFSRRRVRNLVLVAIIGTVASLAIMEFGLLNTASSTDPNDPNYRARHAQSYLDEMSSIEDATDATRVSRLYYWGRAWEMFVDHPLLGVGSGNFPWQVQDYEQKDPSFTSDRPLSGGRVAHSLYFTLLAEYGVIGSAVFVAIGVGLWNRLKRVRMRMATIDGDDSEVMTALSRACSASLLAFLVSGAFLSVLYYPHFWYLLGFAITLDRVSTRMAPEPAKGPRFGRVQAGAATRA